MGNKIKEVRQRVKMTQKELASKSGVSRTIISKLEQNAVQATTTKTLSKIARALGVTVDEIFFDENG